MQRVLTPEEIAQLAKDYEALARWEQVRQFVYALYGSTAYRVKVETTLPYNDEYFQDAEIERIVVYDRQGKEMEPDLTLPFWRQETYVERIEQAIRDEELDDADRRDYGRGTTAIAQIFRPGQHPRLFLPRWPR